MKIGLTSIPKKIKLLQNFFTVIVELTSLHVCRHYRIHSGSIPPKLKTICLDFMIFDFPKRVMAVNSKRAIVAESVMAISLLSRHAPPLGA
ncbi:MAG: hypothetical protein C0407_05665 [Desulfobacca sp.]|nr:hypothetical protein [Desulfobacca sp.]